MLTTILIILLSIGYLTGAWFFAALLDWDWFYLPDLVKILLYPIFIWFEK